MPDLNAFQRLDTREKRLSACREGAAGFLALATAHLFSLAYILNQPAPRPTLFTSDKTIIATSVGVGMVICVAGYFALRRACDPWLAGALIVWSGLGLFHPLTYSLYGWSALPALPVFSLYFGILAVRGALALRRAEAGSA